MLDERNIVGTGYLDTWGKRIGSGKNTRRLEGIASGVHGRCFL